MNQLMKYYRRSIRLKGYDYSQAGVYFVTICTANRERFFGDILKGKMVLNDLGNVVEKYRLITENHFQNIKFDVFIIMPNHFHVIIKIIGTGINPVGAGSPLPYLNDKNPNENDKTPIVNGKNQNTNTGYPNIEYKWPKKINNKPNVNAGNPDVNTGYPDVGNVIGRGNPAPTVGQIVGFFKYGVSKQINLIRNTPGVKLWQRNYYDHIIRNNNEYDRIAEYIKNNPIKWELDFFNHCKNELHPCNKQNE